MIDIFAEYIKNNDGVLMLIGGGACEQNLKEKVKKIGLSDKVIFCGSRIDTEKFYSAMDVFVLPSMWEGLGMVVVEAQASDLDCVVSDRVPHLADLSIGLVKYIGLDKPIEEWVETIKSIRKRSRQDQREAVRRAGYDSTEVANYMQKFYLSLLDMQ